MSMKFEIGTPDSTPETVDYLAVAKANWNAVPGFDGGPDHFMAGAQTCAAISQAESLARIADALEAQQAFMALGRRALLAEGTVARVRDLLAEHPGTAWDSAIKLRDRVLAALEANDTGVTPDGSGLPSDERNRFSDDETGSRA